MGNYQFGGTPGPLMDNPICRSHNGLESNHECPVSFINLSYISIIMDGVRHLSCLFYGCVIQNSMFQHSFHTFTKILELLFSYMVALADPVTNSIQILSNPGPNTKFGHNSVRALEITREAKTIRNLWAALANAQISQIGGESSAQGRAVGTWNCTDAGGPSGPSFPLKKHCKFWLPASHACCTFCRFNRGMSFQAHLTTWINLISLIYSLSRKKLCYSISLIVKPNLGCPWLLWLCTSQSNSKRMVAYLNCCTRDATYEEYHVVGDP